MAVLARALATRGQSFVFIANTAMWKRVFPGLASPSRGEMCGDVLFPEDLQTPSTFFAVIFATHFSRTYGLDAQVLVPAAIDEAVREGIRQVANRERSARARTRAERASSPLTPASSAEDDGDAETRELLRALGEDEEALQLLGGDANDDDDDDALVLEHLELDDDEVALQLCGGDDDDALEHLFDLEMYDASNSTNDDAPGSRAKRRRVTEAKE